MTSSTIRVQDQIVIMNLMSSRKTSIEEAMKIWSYSKTRSEIHDKHSEDLVAPIRCYEELMFELNEGSRWVALDFN